MFKLSIETEEKFLSMKMQYFAIEELYKKSDNEMLKIGFSVTSPTKELKVSYSFDVEGNVTAKVNKPRKGDLSCSK